VTTILRRPAPSATIHKAKAAAVSRLDHGSGRFDGLPEGTARRPKLRRDQRVPGRFALAIGTSAACATA
jgi:hypothetical protein